MIKTDKFNRMIEAFECDFVLARDNGYSLTQLSQNIRRGDEKILKDIELLEELSWLLRNGQAEIFIKEQTENIC